MQTTLLDPFDAQDLALAVHARWVFDVPPAELEELADAVLAWADEPELEQLLDRAVEHCWGSTLEDDLRESLNELAVQVPSCGHRVRSALLDLDARHSASELARAFVLQCATQYAHDGLPMMFCLCCIEERIAAVEPADGRLVALEAARAAVRDVDIEDEELRIAVRACALEPAGVAEMLATAARREAVRRRLSRIAALGSRSLPGLSRELRAAVRQSEEAEHSGDEMWAAVCRELVAAYAEPCLN